MTSLSSNARGGRHWAQCSGDSQMRTGNSVLGAVCDHRKVGSGADDESRTLPFAFPSCVPSQCPRKFYTHSPSLSSRHPATRLGYPPSVHTCKIPSHSSPSSLQTIISQVL